MPAPSIIGQRRTRAKTNIEKVTEHRSRRRRINIPELTTAQWRARRRLECGPVETWLKHYWPGVYTRPFGEPHRKILAAIDHAIDHDQNFVVAMPRGWGKTSTALGGIIKALVDGRCRFPLFVSKTGTQATELLTDAHKFILSERFARDYPEITFPFSASTSPQSFVYQHDGKTGEPVSAARTREYLRLPDLPIRVEGNDKPNPARGAYLWGTGITGDGIRGAHVMTAAGEWLRPDVAMVDDPETADSARSVSQCETRRDLIVKDIAGCGAQGKSIPIIVSTTIQRRGSVGDQLLDQSAHPDYHGLKVPAVATMPTNLSLWEGEYDAERIAGIMDQDGGVRAARFYRQHRKQLDAGCELNWSGFEASRGVESHIQSAMDFYLSNPAAFFSEWQQEPQDTVSALYRVDETSVMASAMEREPGKVPDEAMNTVVGIDINDYALSWAVAYCDETRSVGVTDYGQFPGGSDLWNHRMSVSRAVAVAQGLTALCSTLAKSYTLDMIVIDGNGEVGNVAYSCLANLRQQTGVPVVAGRGAGSRHYYVPQSRKRVMKSGELCHLMKQAKNGKLYPSLFFDSHHWHKDMQLGFLLPAGAPGAVGLHGPARRHQRIASHVCADRLVGVRLTDAGKETMQWEKDEHQKNDLADAVKLAMVGLSVNGYSPSEPEKPQKAKRAKGGIVAVRPRR